MSVYSLHAGSSTAETAECDPSGSDIAAEEKPSSHAGAHIPANGPHSLLLSLTSTASASLLRMLRTLEEDRLPWRADFFDWSEFALPRSATECLKRLNLNIPFYVMNYAQIFCAVTLPLLIVYDPLCLALLCASVITAHVVHQWEKQKMHFSAKRRDVGIPIAYQYFVEANLIALIALLLFFDRFWTLSLVFLVNGVTILPHALIRQPTYFDNEELEKLRPKLLQYILTFAVFVLGYLECKGAGHLCAARNSTPGPGGRQNFVPKPSTDK